MTLSAAPPRHRFPVSIISQAVWIYHRFNNSYRDIEEELAFRGINVSHETIRSWSIKFLNHFRDSSRNGKESLLINGILMK